MQYHHKPRFQIILYRALRAARATHQLTNPFTGEAFSYNDAAMVRELGLGTKYSAALRKFRTQTNVPDFDSPELDALALEACPWRLDKEELARPLWEFLRRGNHISNVMADRNALMRKESLFSLREAATVIGAFYGASENENLETAESHFLRDVKPGQTKTWICYKLSTRRPGYFLKSRFQITLAEGEYFHVEDHQISTGRTEKGNQLTETSKGFGFVKTGRFWCFLHENSHTQPRIFCFWGLTGTGAYTDPIEGNVLEADQLYGQGQFGLPVVLVDPRYDELLWSRQMPDKTYEFTEDITDLCDQIDSFPFSKTKLTLHREEPGENESNAPEDFTPYIHDDIRRSLTERSINVPEE